MQDFRNLKVWEKSHHLTLQIYSITKGFPREELFSLTQQMRRSAMSIPTNIAEGCGRSTNADFARFLWMANGSAKELDYQLILVRDLGYLSGETYPTLANMLDEIKRMLAGLIQVVSAC
ncbi:MAG: four helix bundle protein [Bacteroidales bacterium]|nr:four helix bundle protein [Bacteroidales bacterium]